MHSVFCYRGKIFPLYLPLGDWLTIPQTLRGHHGSALSHIRSGVKILSEIRTKSKDRLILDAVTVSVFPHVRLVTLEVIFNRLDSQVAQVSLLVPGKFTTTHTIAVDWWQTRTPSYWGR